MQPDKPSEPARRTVLLYFAADNNLAPYAKTDLEEAKAGLLASSVEDVHLLAYCDFGGSDARLVELVKQDGTVSEEIVREYGKRNSVGVDETREVFSDVFTHPDYEAESYALVYWSHADGWIPYPVPDTRWIGQDKGEGDKRMNLSDFISTLEGMRRGCRTSISSTMMPVFCSPSRWHTPCGNTPIIIWLRPPRRPAPVRPTSVSCPPC